MPLLCSVNEYINKYVLTIMPNNKCKKYLKYKNVIKRILNNYR